MYFLIIPLFIASLLFTYRMHWVYRQGTHAHFAAYLWIGYGLSIAVGLQILEGFFPAQGRLGYKTVMIAGLAFALCLIGYGLWRLYQSSKTLKVHRLLDQESSDQIVDRWAFDRMSLGVLQIQDDGKISECNIAASTMIGLSAQQLVDTFVWDLGLTLLAENGQPLTEQRIRRFLDNLRRFPHQEVVVGLERDEKEKWFAVKMTNAMDLKGTDESVKDRHRDRGTSGDYPILVTLTEVTTLVQENRKRWYLAHHDPATGLPNRRYFEERLAETLAHSKARRCMFGLLFIDVDDFKDVNDQYGHDVGDEVLIRFSELIKQVVGQDDMVARYGGDEFVILLSSIKQRSDAWAVAAAVGHMCQFPLIIDGKMVTLSASIGVSIYPVDGKDAATLMRHADQAMYRAKAPFQDESLR